MSGDLALNLRNTSKRLVPTCLQFTGHQPVSGVGSVVLSEGAVGSITRCFEIAFECFENLIPMLLSFFFGSNSRRNGARPDHSEDRIPNSVIDTQTAKRDATRFAIVHPAAA